MRRLLIWLSLGLLLIGAYSLCVVEKWSGVPSLMLGWPSSGVVGSSSSVVGPPSVSAAFINRVLDAYSSPAAGLGQALYDDGVAVGIDPVYALAFFQHESTMGRYGWGHDNHSLGNIRCSAGYACQGGYRYYATWEEGFRDWYKLIREMYVDQLGLRTVAQIIPVYAPAADHNDEGAYINHVETAVASWRAGRVVV